MAKIWLTSVDRTITEWRQIDDPVISRNILIRFGIEAPSWSRKYSGYYDLHLFDQQYRSLDEFATDIWQAKDRGAKRMLANLEERARRTEWFANGEFKDVKEQTKRHGGVVLATRPLLDRFLRENQPFRARGYFRGTELILAWTPVDASNALEYQP